MTRLEERPRAARDRRSPGTVWIRSRALQGGAGSVALAHVAASARCAGRLRRDLPSGSCPIAVHLPWTPIRRCSPGPPTGSAKQAGSAIAAVAIRLVAVLHPDEWLDRCPLLAPSSASTREAGAGAGWCGRGGRRHGRQVHDVLYHGRRPSWSATPAADPGRCRVPPGLRGTAPRPRRRCGPPRPRRSRDWPDLAPASCRTPGEKPRPGEYSSTGNPPRRRSTGAPW